MVITSLTDSDLSRWRLTTPLRSRYCSSLGRKVWQKSSTCTNNSSKLSIGTSSDEALEFLSTPSLYQVKSFNPYLCSRSCWRDRTALKIPLLFIIIEQSTQPLRQYLPITTHCPAERMIGIGKNNDLEILDPSLVQICFV